MPVRSKGDATLKHWVVWLAAPAIVCLGGCGRKDAAEAKSDPPRAVTVAVAKARHQDLSRELVLTAEFRPFQEIDVHAKVAGFVKKIYVDVGDRVRSSCISGISSTVSSWPSL